MKNNLCPKCNSQDICHFPKVDLSDSRMDLSSNIFSEPVWVENYFCLQGGYT